MRFVWMISCLLLNSIAFSAELNPQVALDTHNKWRNALNQGSVGSQPVPNPFLADMYWDESLAASAQAHSDQCVWQYSDTGGENLYAQIGFSGSIADVVDLWAEELYSYDYDNNSSIDGEEVGHYTQLIWHDSLKVGCAKSYCSPIKKPDGSDLWAGTLYTCQYRESGNRKEQKPYSISVTPPNTTAHYTSVNGDVELPLVKVGDQFYRVKMKLTHSEPFILETLAYQQLTTDIDSILYALISSYQYPLMSSYDDAFLIIPNLVVDGDKSYYLKLKHLGFLVFEVIEGEDN